MSSRNKALYDSITKSVNFICKFPPSFFSLEKLSYFLAWFQTCESPPTRPICLMHLVSSALMAVSPRLEKQSPNQEFSRQDKDVGTLWLVSYLTTFVVKKKKSVDEIGVAVQVDSGQEI